MDFNLKITSKEDFIADMAGIGVDISALLTENYVQTDKVVVDWIGEVEVEGVVGLYVNVRTLSYQLKISLPADVAGLAAQAAGVPIYDYEKITEVSCVITQELILANLPHATVLETPIRTFA